MPDPYYAPEQLGLKTIAEIDYSDGCYNFDFRVVWRHLKSGRLVTARDAGCSCPSPFEDYHAVEDLEVLNLDELVREVHSETSNTTAEDRARFLRTVRRAAAKK